MGVCAAYWGWGVAYYGGVLLTRVGVLPTVGMCITYCWGVLPNMGVCVLPTRGYVLPTMGMCCLLEWVCCLLWGCVLSTMEMCTAYYEGFVAIWVRMTQSVK